MFDTATSRFRRFARTAWAADWNFLSTEMSARMFFLDFVVFPPLILVFLVLSVWQADALQWLTSAGLVVVGIGVWTLAEYLIHRFAFHHFPLLKAVHLAHHDDPRGLTGTPTILTVVVFLVLVYWPAAEIGSRASAAAWTAGMLLGYLAYVSVHYVVHHLGSGGWSWLRRLIRAHAVHHHDSSRNFGVTTVLWDRVFGTLGRR